MKLVVDTCAKQHGRLMSCLFRNVSDVTVGIADLFNRFRTSHDEINLLKEGANEVRETVNASRTADVP